ncbi:hypothetical protein ACFL1E_06145 [Candidatus Omnitrophota bacterium]
MGISSSTMNAFSALEGYIRINNRRHASRFLTIGTMDFHVTKGCLKKHSIGTISEQDLKDHYAVIGDERNKSSKQLCAQLFRHYGYQVYEELDINRRADVLYDLNYPIDKKLENKYDCIFNVSAHYAMNAPQAFFNTARMTKVGGKMLVNTALGDMTNRFYLNPSPNFLIDFYTANGFVLEKAIMQNRRGYTLPYEPAKFKVTWIGAIIPFHFFLSYYFRKFLLALNLRLTLGRHRAIRSALSQKQGEQNKSTQNSEETIKEKLATLKRRLQTFFGEKGFRRIQRLKDSIGQCESRILQWIDPDWNVWCVLRKVEEVEEPRFTIISTYRDEYAITGKTNPKKRRRRNK